ncbi:uncharacterized protein LOC142341595 isoform X2 [Convolutriloba macropyga]|uniref:uncharacterized protein LOC142341595 isoform X2 n=1 Tax=Convolutriloba macropyga TaxID=536237 RepID=UPI003F5270AC
MDIESEQNLEPDGPNDVDTMEVGDLVFGLQNLRNNRTDNINIAEFSTTFLHQFFSFFLLGNERMTQQVKSIGDVDSITMLLEEKKRDLEIVSQMGLKLVDEKCKVCDENCELTQDRERLNKEVVHLKQEVEKKNELIGILFEKEYVKSDPVNYGDADVVTKLNGRIIEELQTKVKNLEQENKQLKETTSQCIKQAETLESKETLLVEEIHSILTHTQQDFQNVSLELNKSSQDLQRQEEEKGRILRELVDAHRKNKDLASYYESLVAEVDYLQACRDQVLEEQIRNILQKYPANHNQLVGQARWKHNSSRRGNGQNRSAYSANRRQIDDIQNAEKLAAEQENAKREAEAKEAAEKFYEETMRDKQRQDAQSKQSEVTQKDFPAGSGRTYAQAVSRHQSMDNLNHISPNSEQTSPPSPFNSSTNNAMLNSFENKIENFYGREFTPTNKTPNPALNSKYANGPLHGNRDFNRNFRRRAQNQEELLNSGPVSVSKKDFNPQNGQSEDFEHSTKHGVHARLGNQNSSGMKRYNSNNSLSGYDYESEFGNEVKGQTPVQQNKGSKNRHNSSTRNNRKHSSQSRTRSDTYNENNENQRVVDGKDGGYFQGKNGANFNNGANHTYHGINNKPLNRYGSLNNLNCK